MKRIRHILREDTMRRALHFLIQSRKKSSTLTQLNRRHFLLGAAATAFAGGRANLLAAAFAPLPDHADPPLKIEAVELVALPGRYTQKAGTNSHHQYNPLHPSANL